LDVFQFCFAMSVGIDLERQLIVVGSEQQLAAAWGIWIFLGC